MPASPQTVLVLVACAAVAGCTTNAPAVGAHLDESREAGESNAPASRTFLNFSWDVLSGTLRLRADFAGPPHNVGCRVWETSERPGASGNGWAEVDSDGRIRCHLPAPSNGTAFLHYWNGTVWIRSQYAHVETNDGSYSQHPAFRIQDFRIERPVSQVSQPMAVVEIAPPFLGLVPYEAHVVVQYLIYSADGNEVGSQGLTLHPDGEGRYRSAIPFAPPVSPEGPGSDPAHYVVIAQAYAVAPSLEAISVVPVLEWGAGLCSDGRCLVAT